MGISADSVKAKATACLTAVILSGCALLGSGDGEDAAHRVINAYRLESMLEQSAPIVTQAVAANLPSDVAEGERERIRQAIVQAYDTQQLTIAVTGRLADKARDAGRVEDLQRAAARLESALAQKMIALENAAGGEEFEEGFSDFLQQPPQASDKADLRRMRELAQDMHLVALQTAYNLGMLRGMIVARNAVAPPEFHTSPEVMARMVEQTRHNLRQHLSRQVPVMLLYAYRDVPRQRRTAYRELQHGEALQWVNSALAEVLGQALRTAAEDIPERYRALGPADDQA